MTREGYLKHKEVFHAWVDGAIIEFSRDGFDSCNWFISDGPPKWSEDTEYRVKPFIPKQGDTILVGTDDAIFPRVFVKMDCGKFRCIGKGMNDWSMDGNKLHTHVWSVAKPYKG